MTKMKCLQCGYCCKNLCVVVVDDPKKGINEHNLIYHKGLGQPCKHLKQINENQYECSIHHYEWYKQTPCFAYTQIEKDPNEPCRMGKYLLKKITNCS